MDSENAAPGQIYGRSGSLEVRLADGAADIELAQRLRYQVFFEEMSATPTPEARRTRRDTDPFDDICDHLLVVDHAPLTCPTAAAAEHHSDPSTNTEIETVIAKPLVVGTYRVLRQEVVQAKGLSFYTQSEYDIAALIATKSTSTSFMELGRSCVLKPYRNKRLVELLWHGLWTYVRQHNIDVMLGCASFEGTDTAAHAMALSFLHHNAGAPADWCASAHRRLHQPMDLLPADQVDTRAALRGLPPLIKGYLRLGAYVGDGAVVDHEFGTTDVLIILPVSRIDPRYFAHFGAPDERKSRIASS